MQVIPREDMVHAWRLAALDLGVRVAAPFRLILSDEAADVLVVALVHDFGSPRGAILATIDDDRSKLTQLTSAAGYFVSFVNPEIYSAYTRETFVDTLNDWQYFGSQPPPDWYTGQPWTK